MKIDKKKFNKLKQLDRIEFRQKFNNIENIGFSISKFMFTCFIIGCIFLSTAILSQNILLTNLSIKFFILSIFIWIIECLLCIGVSIKRKNLREELFEEYFLVEVKKK